MARTFEEQLKIEPNTPKSRWPDFYLNKPALHKGLWFYLECFYDLSTCRQSAMGVGSIPWTAIVQMLNELEIEDFQERSRFIAVIRGCDDAYVSAIQEKQDQEDRMRALRGKDSKQ